MLGWFYRVFGKRTRGGMNAVLGGLDSLFHPEAVRSRESIERDHSMVEPMPSPGDKLLKDGLVVERPPQPPDEDAGE